MGLLATLAACREPPFGEIVVVVDTDMSVPRFVGRLRIDLFTPGGQWYDSRDVAAPDRADWPVSFSVFTDGMETRRTRVRLRAYPEGRLRDYRGERFEEPRPPFVQPFVADSLEKLCDTVPLLPPRTERTLRRGARPLTTIEPTPECQRTTESGSVAVRVEIQEKGRYRFEVVRAEPDGGYSWGDTTLFLRRVCEDPASQVACHDDIDPTSNFLSRLQVELAPGQYYLMVGGRAWRQPADITLRWALETDWSLPSLSPSPGEPNTAGPPRLLIDGRDASPLHEPRPRVTIDRLVDLDVAGGLRRTASVLLAGECIGTMADLAGGRTCVDTSGALREVEPVPLRDGIDRGGPSVSGTWIGEQTVDCTATPRSRGRAVDGTDLFDEEVCIPGGAFLFGDATAAFDASDAAEQVVVVAPFLMDRYELTVARFRQALRDGFFPLDDTPPVNDGPLLADGGWTADTWNGSKSGPSPLVGASRERFPLNSLSTRGAAALCRFLGADLPSEAQWEYAASAAGRAGRESRYPLGEDVPTCDDAVFGRKPGVVGDEDECIGKGAGPVAVDEEPWASRDTTPAGVVGMTGSLAEPVSGSGRPYADPCWRQRLLRGVDCEEEDATRRVSRGSDWANGGASLLASSRFVTYVSTSSEEQGVRCARPGRKR